MPEQLQLNIKKRNGFSNRLRVKKTNKAKTNMPIKKG